MFTSETKFLPLLVRNFKNLKRETIEAYENETEKRHNLFTASRQDFQSKSLT